MKKIITLMFVSLMLFGMGIVSANHDAPVQSLRCTLPSTSLVEWSNCHPQVPDEPSEPEPTEASGGGGGRSVNIVDVDLRQRRYNQCMEDLWFISVRPTITAPEGVSPGNLISLLTNPNYAICYPDFWFNVFKPIFFDR